MLTILQSVPRSIEEFNSEYGDLIVSFGITVVSFVVTFLLLYLVGKPLAVRLTHYEAEAPPSRSAGLPMLNRKHNRVEWGGSRQHPTVTHAQSQP